MVERAAIPIADASCVVLIPQLCCIGSVALQYIATEVWPFVHNMCGRYSFNPIYSCISPSAYWVCYAPFAWYRNESTLAPTPPIPSQQEVYMQHQGTTYREL